MLTINNEIKKKHVMTMLIQASVPVLFIYGCVIALCCGKIISLPACIIASVIVAVYFFIVFYSYNNTINILIFDFEKGSIYKTINNKTVTLPFSEIKSCYYIERGISHLTRLYKYEVRLKTIQGKNIVVYSTSDSDIDELKEYFKIEKRQLTGADLIALIIFGIILLASVIAFIILS